MWHASIAELDMRRQRTTPAAELAPATKRLIVRAAKALLSDVGQMPSMVEQFVLAIHYRRAVTDLEIALLPEWWCHVPAVHQAGRGLILEKTLERPQPTGRRAEVPAQAAQEGHEVEHHDVANRAEPARRLAVPDAVDEPGRS